MNVMIKLSVDLTYYPRLFLNSFFLLKKKKAPRVDNRRESYIVPANSLALIRSVLGEKRLKGFDSLKGKRRRGGCIQGYNSGV